MEQRQIRRRGIVSRGFLERGIPEFSEAIHYIHQLPYGRNSNKQDLYTVFADGCATCSTKHAILKQLASENEWQDVSLYLGIFRMQKRNTHSIDNILSQHKLEYIPEAHCYLKIAGGIVDVTHPQIPIRHSVDDMENEIEIQPDQIGSFKVHYHKSVLNQWLQSQPHIPYTAEEIWHIREQCIAALSSQ